MIMIMMMMMMMMMMMITIMIMILIMIKIMIIKQLSEYCCLDTELTRSHHCVTNGSLSSEWSILLDS